MKTALDKFYGTILGLACGDALGAPTEFMRVPEIHRRFGLDGIRDIAQTNGRFTDDTQMTVALARGLVDAWEGSKSLDAKPEATLADTRYLMPLIANRFVEWSISPKNNRAPGNTCMAGCRALRNGVNWQEAGVPESKGCGAAMRVAPIGLVYWDARTIGRAARASARITHGHRVAGEAAHVAARAVSLLMQGFNPDLLIPTLIYEVKADGGLDQDFEELLGRAEEAVRRTLEGRSTPEEVQATDGLGEAWTADEAVACALYCFLLAHKRGQGYVETVRYGANTDGDSDSIACIAGSFAGAYWGVAGDHGVPAEWIGKIEDAEALSGLASALFVVSITANGEPMREAIRAETAGATE
jgi:ADP-ribosylglycohydrolase